MSIDLPSRHTIRLRDFDYSSSNWYYVTICVQDRECLLGKIVGGEVHINSIGHIVNIEWLKLRLRFSNIGLDKFITMPNHFHGILILRPGRENPAPTLGQIIAYFKYQTTKQYNVIVGARSSRPSNSLPQINKLWQRNYYEHIIRDEGELNHVRKYILDNPSNWTKDKLFL